MADDDLMARRAAKLAPGTAITPRHLRFIGGYFLFAFAVLAGVNVYSWRSGQLWPKALIIAPSVLFIGLWLLVDARALVAGTRRHQRAFVWAFILAGTGTGIAILHALTGRFF